jgi:hypothetical protein
MKYLQKELYRMLAEFQAEIERLRRELGRI